ncbi:hypothetical protein K5X82_06905 [Halosquirtibacter xylanolyticus]|uniref:hypothetical protein n=1 Tax=Halosquirtibacter xylanolyticus TaxID=3374599 RepID=UPI00374A8037|nr:hypothetical protein K5X82_06905 [Prolixibacteraceae bacterium]
MTRKRDKKNMGILVVIALSIAILITGIKMYQKKKQPVHVNLPVDTLNYIKQEKDDPIKHTPQENQVNRAETKNENQKDKQVHAIKPQENTIEFSPSKPTITISHPKPTHEIPSLMIASYDRKEVGLFPNFNVTTYTNKKRALWVASLNKVSKFLIHDTTEIKYVHSLKYPGNEALKKEQINAIRENISQVENLKQLKELLINNQQKYQSELPITNTAYNDQFIIGKGIHLYLYADEELDAPNAAIALLNMWIIPKKYRTVDKTRILAVSTDNQNIIVLLSNGHLFELNKNLKTLSILKLKEGQIYNPSIIKGKDRLVVTSNKGIFEIQKSDKQWSVINFTSLNLQTQRAVLQAPKLLTIDNKQIFVALTQEDNPKILFYKIGDRETDFPYFTHSINTTKDTNALDIQIIHNQLYLYQIGKAGEMMRLHVDYENKSVTPIWKIDNNIFILLHNDNHQRIFSVSKEGGKWRINSISVDSGKTIKYLKLDLSKDYLPTNEAIQPIGPNHFVYAGVLDLLECQITEP